MSSFIPCITLLPAGGAESKLMEFPLPADGTLVPDSVRSYLTVVGDVMGPALSNIDDLLRMPYGCGEQNMVGFSPNVFVLQYLEGSNRDTAELREKALTHMKSGELITVTIHTYPPQLQLCNTRHQKSWCASSVFITMELLLISRSG